MSKTTAVNSGRKRRKGSRSSSISRSRKIRKMCSLFRLANADSNHQPISHAHFRDGNVYGCFTHQQSFSHRHKKRSFSIFRISLWEKKNFSTRFSLVAIFILSWSAFKLTLLQIWDFSEGGKCREKLSLIQLQKFLRLFGKRRKSLERELS